MTRKITIYDVETLKTLFSACFLDVTTGKRKEFVLFDDIEQLKELVRFLLRLQKNDYTLCGFNVLGFDSQILEYILREYSVWIGSSWSVPSIVSSIYSEAQRIIGLPEETRYFELIPEHKLTIPHIDLFKQKHYDGKAKRGTSLKWIQFTMRYPTVEEMPIEHDAIVQKEQVSDILSYNWNDVESTGEFFNKIKFETELRDELSQRYDLSLLNASEPRLAKMIFAKFLCEEMKITYKELKDMRTMRKKVALKDVIFPYINFKSEELRQVFDVVNKQVININEKGSFKHNFIFGGINTDIGLGGIHACTAPGVYDANESLIIQDIDVTSFYPNLAIENDVKPAHLGASFNKVYKSIFEERKKIPKKDPINYVYKIILNSTYGLSKEINSYLYDPFFTYSITINGQLSLLMLVEALVDAIPDLKIYQENTDGISIGYHPKYRGLVNDICREWERTTKLSLEHAFYKRMVIRDVNNYIAIKDDFNWEDYQKLVKQGKRKEYGSIKHKGAFELEIDYHKNPSFNIVPLAVEAHFIGGLDFRKFIREHDDIYDFLGGVKSKSNFTINQYMVNNSIDSSNVENIPKYLEDKGWMEYYGSWVKKEWIDGGLHYDRMAVDMVSAYKNEQKQIVKCFKQQKVTRYYISTDGGQLMKDFDDGRKVAINSGWKATILNKVDEQSALTYKNIDYSFYTKETEKLIQSIEKTKQLNLF